MAYQRCFFRLKVSTALIFMLFSQAEQLLNAQPNPSEKWQALDNLLENKLPDLGGRAVMLVWKDGKIQYSKTLNNLSNKQEMIGKRIAKKQGKDPEALLGDFNPDSRQRIASSSKWLSAALVMSFVDEGKLSLEDSIGKYLPVMTANGKGAIKIWQCLSHLTGIKQTSIADEMNRPENPDRRNFSEGENGSGNRQNPWPSMAAAMDSIAIQPMEGEPGKTFHYGNAGLQICAAILEKISGRSFNELFVERLAKPLGMQHTDFGKGPVPLAAGGAWSTPNDYLKFLVMLLQKGQYNGQQILKESSVNAMQVNLVTQDVKVVYSPAEAGNWGYGFGEWVAGSTSTVGEGDGLIRQGSFFVTSPGLFGSFPWIDNDKQYAAFLFVLNLKNKGRHELYHDLKMAVDKGLAFSDAGQ